MRQGQRGPVRKSERQRRLTLCSGSREADLSPSTTPSPLSPPPPCPQPGHWCPQSCPGICAHSCAHMHRLYMQQRSPVHPHLPAPQGHTPPCTCTHSIYTQHLYTSSPAHMCAQVHSDTCSPPHTLKQTHAHSSPCRAAHLPANACTLMHADYSLASALDPLEQRPVSCHLAHPSPTLQGFTLHYAPHSSTSSTTAASAATSGDSSKGTDFCSQPAWKWEVDTQEGEEQGGAGEGPASLPWGVSLFIAGLIPSCLCCHLRDHLGNPMQCQPQGTASEPPQQRSGPQTCAGTQGVCRPTGGLARPLTPPSPCPLTTRLQRGHWAIITWRQRRGKGPDKNPGCVSLTRTRAHARTHTHTCQVESVSVKRLPSGPQQGQPLPHPSTHQAAAGAPSTGGRARVWVTVRTGLQTRGLGTGHLEVLLTTFGALGPSSHCPRAQPAWGAREQGDVCERKRQRRQSSFR